MSNKKLPKIFYYLQSIRPEVSLKNFDILPPDANGSRKIKNSGKMDNATSYAGTGVSMNGINQLVSVPVPYSTGDDVCDYKDYVLFDGTQADFTSLYSQYVSTTPYTSYVIKVDIKSANDLSKAGIRFGINDWYSFAQYGITTTGIHYFATISSSDTREYVRWFARSGFEGEFGNVEIREILQGDLVAYSFDLTNGELVKKVMNRKIIQYDIGRNNNALIGYYVSEKVNNYIIVDGGFTAEQEDALRKSPETFLYKDDGILKSDTMTQYEIDNVIDYFPLCEIDSNIVSAISGTSFPIKNYASSVRDDSKQLLYGLQSNKLVRDSNGIPISLSTYLECDGVGYIDTGWTPTGYFYIEEVVRISSTEIHHYVYDSDGNKFTDGASDGTYTVPTTDTKIGLKTFDGISDVMQVKLFNVYNKPQDTAKLYQKAVDAGLLQ